MLVLQRWFVHLFVYLGRQAVFSVQGVCVYGLIGALPYGPVRGTISSGIVVHRVVSVEGLLCSSEMCTEWCQWRSAVL